MAGDRKGPATFYLQPLPFSGDRKWPDTERGQPLPFSGDRKWPETESGQRKEAAIVPWTEDPAVDSNDPFTTE